MCEILCFKSETRVYSLIIVHFVETTITLFLSVNLEMLHFGKFYTF